MTNAQLANAIDEALRNGNSDLPQLLEMARNRGIVSSVAVVDIPRVLRRFPVGQDGITDQEWLGKYQWPRI